MLERELTLQNGKISKELPKGFVWLRLGDTGNKTRNKLGCDGFVFFSGKYFWITEVKMNTSKLTDSEIVLRDWCLENKINHIVLRYHEKLGGLWELEMTGKNLSVVNSKLSECFEEIIDK